MGVQEINFQILLDSIFLYSVMILNIVKRTSNLLLQLQPTPNPVLRFVCSKMYDKKQILQDIPQKTSIHDTFWKHTGITSHVNHNELIFSN